jgi:hypothetical protein
MSYTPAGVLDSPTQFSGGRSRFALNDHRLPSINPAGWPLPVSSLENVQTAANAFGVLESGTGSARQEALMICGGVSSATWLPKNRLSAG